MFRKHFLVLAILLGHFCLFAQSNGSEKTDFQPALEEKFLSQMKSPEYNLPDNIESRTLVALTTVDYLVTPGDTYILSFFKSTQQTSSKFFVETDYIINLGIFGKLKAQGMTFPQLKTRIEFIVEKSYPGSSPSLNISSVGIFTVLLLGEVEQSRLYNVWGLTRLSEVLNSNLMPDADIRNVKIRSAGGEENFYDLFRVGRYGDLGQNPYLRPGDIIQISRAARVVTLAGEVRRPGRYQLLPNEGFKQLIEIYGGGFSGIEDRNRIDLVRLEKNVSPGFSKKLLSYDFLLEYPIQDKDFFTVNSIKNSLPVIWFEGAVAKKSESGDVVSGRIEYTFFPGEKLTQAIQNMRSSFTENADLNNVVFIRDYEPKILDLHEYLYGSNNFGDFELQQGDIIRISLRQLLISVSGAVLNPGRYPYVPNRTWEYYINLAGGFDTERNSLNSLVILDSKGIRQKKDRFIEPDDTIKANSNSFLYNFERFMPVVSTLGTAATIITALVSLTK